MTTIRIADECGSDLSSRHVASALRKRVVALSADGRVTLNFEGVRTLSDSFADELCAVLVQERGKEWFKKNVCITNISVVIRQTILEAVQHRLNCATA